VLETNSHGIGLTFGIDIGTLVKFVMNQKIEYVGRALNVASRLQASIVQKKSQQDVKLLISKSAFAELGLNRLKKYEGKLVERVLKNLSDGAQYQAREVTLPCASKLIAEAKKRIRGVH
jgi:hypothetical protein